MKRMTQFTTLGVLAAVTAGAFAPLAARADDRSTQNNKNLMRNLALGAGALGLYGLANHNNTLGLLGVAGAAVAGSQYEKDRKNQSVDNSRDQNRYYHRNYGGFDNSSSYRYNTGGNRYDNNSGYQNNGYNNGDRYNSGYNGNNNGDRYNNGGGQDWQRNQDNRDR